MTRDRSSVYANAITTACPKAVQVADRWHLLANLSEVVERFLDTQRANINQSILATLPATGVQAIPQPVNEEQLPPSLTWHNDLSKLMATTRIDCTSKSFERYQKIKQLQAQGHGIRAIARHLGLARNTVKRYWHQQEFMPRQTPKRSNLYLYEGYLRRRWLEGQTNATALLAEIKAFGYNGSYTILASFLSIYPRSEAEPALPPARKGNSFSRRRICRLLNRLPSEWQLMKKNF